MRLWPAAPRASSRAPGSPTRGWDGPKASSASVAARIFDGLDRGEGEIFPDDVSTQIAQEWRSSAFKALELQLAAAAAGEQG